MQHDVHKKPLIGITCGEIINRHEAWWPITYGQSDTYVNSVIEAGGTPILLPLTTDEIVLGQLFDMLDGVYLAGGNDLHPRLYGQEPYKADGDYSDLRDATEIYLLKRALEAKKPILAICRGMQLLNVHFGGTLIQDIPTFLPGKLDHDSSSKLKTLVDVSHALRIEPDTKLANILGASTIGTNAHHHQAIDKLGHGIRATAWAEDEIIEAIELTNYPYAVGIQAHPESLTEVEPRWRALFKTFVDASKK